MDDQDDINAPTVPSGARTNGNGLLLGVPKSKAELLTLIDQKDNVESELRALGEVLDSHKVDMNTPLVTPDGFPRADIDVAQIRITRSRINHLKTDYKALMSLIEQGLHAFHGSLPPSSSSSTTTTTTNATAPPAPSTVPSNPPSDPENVPSSMPLALPFCKVNSIAPSSPAETAGLEVGDVILSFGSVRGDGTSGPLGRLPALVAASEGQELAVRVQRTRKLNEIIEMTENMALTLVPRSGWGGRGLLGCHLVPF